MIETIRAFYRCPENVISLGLTAPLCSEAGYFRFGHDSVCYGQLSSGTPAKAVGKQLRDLSQDVSSDELSLRLPFDLSQVVDNLRYERYAADGYAGKRAVRPGDALSRAYYLCRPWLGVSARKHIQRLFLRNWADLPFPKWPLDTTVEQILEKVLLLAMPGQKVERFPFIWFWPDGAQSCAMVTHDVETKAGVEFTSRLMDIDDAFGLKASFQVIPEKQYVVPHAFLAEIRSRGFEVNVQDLRHDGNLFSDREHFLLQAQAINRYLREFGARGFRSGRMFRNVDWYDALENDYDMSVPNVAHLEAQRGGCCTVFPYFIGKILELPLTTCQDYSLFHILGDYSIELWKKQISLITERHGLVSVLVHPDYLVEERPQEVYKALLRYLTGLRNESKTWIALPGDVERWWRERSQMNLVWEEGEWRIHGPGQGRARIAYARIVNDKLVYQAA